MRLAAAILDSVDVEHFDDPRKFFWMVLLHNRPFISHFVDKETNPERSVTSMRQWLLWSLAFGLQVLPKAGLLKGLVLKDLHKNLTSDTGGEVFICWWVMASCHVVLAVSMAPTSGNSTPITLHPCFLYSQLVSLRWVHSTLISGVRMGDKSGQWEDCISCTQQMNEIKS